MVAQAFGRVRIGIGRPANPAAVSDFVLGKFTHEEKALLHDVSFVSAMLCLGEWLAVPQN